MEIYIILYFTCIGALFISKKEKALVIPILLLWAMFAFRDLVGVDDINYIKSFENLSKGWSYDIEFSYQLLAAFANKMGLNYKALFFFYATVSYILLYKGINTLYKTNQRKALFMACFFGLVFVSAMSVMRQFLSACFCFLATALLYKENKLIKPLILCVIASLFHGGAVIAIPFLFFMRPQVHITYKAKLIVIFLCVLVGYSGIITRVLEYSMHLFPGSYQIYSSSISGSFSSAGGTLSIILLVLFFVQALMSLRAGIKEPTNKMQIVMEKGQLAYLGLLFLFVHAGVASRLAFSFLLFSATIPLTFMQRIKKKDRVLTMLAFFALMLVLYLRAINSVALSGEGGFLPYNASLKFWS